ncbi:MAG: ATP-binding protein [Fibrobacter sp.]|nr:ATP-binding protein [Fibrobacter sp.]
MLKRTAYDRLLEWKSRSQGSSALLIKGARRVGKSFLIKDFAQREYKSHIFIDFGHVPKQVLDLFEHETDDFELFFAKLSSFCKVKLYRRESLIVFDEVQLYPRARQLIKYLVADGRFDYIESGSLISLRQNTKDILIPSEEESIEMYPLTFEEYLWADGDEVTYPLIKSCFEKKVPLGPALHRKVLNRFREYMLVGGMPQAVNAFMEAKDFAKADRAKREILNLYRNDVTKFAKGVKARVLAVFDKIPAQLSKKEKRYKFSMLGSNARYRSYENAFVWLNEAMIVNSCFNATDPRVGLALSADVSTQKCYMADTGLLVTQTFMDKSYTSNELYRAILFDKLDVNEGMIMENVVAQMLRSSGHNLYFYSRSDSANKKNNMEIDFLVKKMVGLKEKICPMEVKSGSYKQHVSLDKFWGKFKKDLSTPYILYTKDLEVRKSDYGPIVHLPLYMAGLL